MPEKTQGFTEDQVEDFKEVFQLFDTKGDGLIQVTQVGEVLRALGQNPTEGDVKKLDGCHHEEGRYLAESSRHLFAGAVHEQQRRPRCSRHF